MSEEWKKQDRECAPCKNCGTELYEKFWGNGGWAPTEKLTERFHDDSRCVRALRAQHVTPLRAQVRAFHVAMGVPADAMKPTIVADERVRLRAALIAEEFAETMAALFDLNSDHPDGPGSFGGVERLLARLKYMVENAPVRVNMVELADGLADLDYVVEGTRLEMGIDGDPIAAEVHRANMSKVGGPIAPNGKRLKPPGWTPPDIVGELKRQGFEG